MGAGLYPYLFLIFFYTTGTTKLLGQSGEVAITENRGYLFDLTKEGLFLLDSLDNIHIDQVSNLQDSNFNFNTSQFNPILHKKFWIKLTLNLSDKLKEHWILEIFNKQAKEIIVYTKTANHTFEAIDTIGANIPFYDRNLHERFPAFEIPLFPGRNTLYIHYTSHQNLALNTTVQPYRNYINYSNHYYFIIGGFYFILFTLTLYNFLFFISTNDKIYLYYILLVISAALDCLKADQIGYALFWPGHPEINLYAEKYIRLLFIFSILNYASYFLSVKQLFPKVYLALWSIFSLFSAVYIFFEECLPGHVYGLWINEVLIVTMLLLLLYAAIIRLKQNHKPTRIFIVGYLSVLIGFVVTYLFYSGWIEGNHLVYYILFYAILIDTFMFSFALSARLKHERIEKERALEAENLARKQQIELMMQNEILLNKVNAELEEKVKERTAEIEESKRKIAEQADIIMQFNINLDKENWQLNKTIKSLQLKKIIPEYLTYKQMKALFPSDSDHYKFLSEFKWKNGFQCKKCHNTKEARSNDFYSKRCSKCGTIESITAHTLFHKLKFPLDKAFYIVYAVYTSRENLIVTELSNELDLNYKTCLNFKLKIEEALEARKKRGIQVKSWEDLISDI